eukprot:5417529-Prymnesium_polylepis.1
MWKRKGEATRSASWRVRSRPARAGFHEVTREAMAIPASANRRSSGVASSMVGFCTITLVVGSSSAMSSAMPGDHKHACGHISKARRREQG